MLLPSIALAFEIVFETVFEIVLVPVKMLLPTTTSRVLLLVVRLKQGLGLGLGLIQAGRGRDWEQAEVSAGVSEERLPFGLVLPGVGRYAVCGSQRRWLLPAPTANRVED